MSMDKLVTCCRDLAYSIRFVWSVLQLDTNQRMSFVLFDHWRSKDSNECFFSAETDETTEHVGKGVNVQKTTADSDFFSAETEETKM